MKPEKQIREKGKVGTQIVEATRINLELLDKINYGEVVFYIKDGVVWRMTATVSRMLMGKDYEAEEIK